MQLIKVKDTRMHKVTTVPQQLGKFVHVSTEVPVAEGKLVLINTGEQACGNFWLNHDGKTFSIHSTDEGDRLYKALLKSILISETEKIEVGDCAYNLMTKRYGRVLRIMQNGDITIDNGQYEDTSSPNNFAKVLALPEHFSQQHIQMIVDGQLKDGDKVLVECEQHEEWAGTGSGIGQPTSITFIKLNSSNHITLHKIE